MSATNKIYLDGDKIVQVTKDSPEGFKDVLFVTREGMNPDQLSESVRSAEQLQKLTPVEASILPAEWRTALGLAELPEEKPPTGEATVVKVVETRYVKMNPGIAKASVPLFMGMLLVMLLTSIPFNGAFAALCIGGGLYAVLYQCAITKKAGEVVHERV